MYKESFIHLNIILVEPSLHIEENKITVTLFERAMSISTSILVRFQLRVAIRCINNSQELLLIKTKRSLLGLI